MVHFATDNPQALLKSFDARIDQSAPKGKITTWKRSQDGNYYTHTSAEWGMKAWFKPKVDSERLIFNIIKPKNSDISTIVYGYYHGHLIETFLNHFDQAFHDGMATATPTSGDLCSD